MKIGKVPETVLNRSVLRPLLLAGAAGDSAVFGKDCAVFAVGNRETGSEASTPRLAAAVVTGTLDGPFDRTLEMLLASALLNLATEGARGEKVLLSLLLPEEEQEESLKRLMNQAGALCARYQLTVEGGHTEVSSAIRRPVVTVTCLGALPREEGQRVEVAAKQGFEPRMELVMAGWTGAAGTAILAEGMKERLLERFPFRMVEAARDLEMLRLLPEAARARNHFGVSALHDVSQGGVFAALWELAECAGAGLEVDLKKIPIRQETIEICEYFQINPYQLYGQGALLLGTYQGEELVTRLRERSIEAAVIGTITGNRQRMIRNGEEIRYLDRPGQDELWRLARQLEEE